MQSIPPSSMMIKTDLDPDKSGAGKKCQRTDFLGAFKETSSSQAQPDANKESAKNEEEINNFDDSQSSALIRSTLADVNHAVSFSNVVESASKPSDSLSELFDQMTDNNQGQAPPDPQNQEMKEA